LTFLYLDASAIVKGYVFERGSERVAHMFEAADHVFTCKVAFAEVLATLRRKRDEQPLYGAEIDQLANQFYQDWESIAAIELGVGLLDIVRHQAFRHSLRALDLLHLSAALWLTAATSVPVIFVCSDQQLLAAARRESLPVLDPEVDDPATLG
jgi:predicted nucleic acid-binding protein